MKRDMPRGDGGGQALVLIGMHRSGTSAATGALKCLGVALGERLYAGHQHVNAKGYFEHSDIADANDAALLALGSSWDDLLPRPAGWWKKDELQPFSDMIRKCIRRDFSTSQLWAVKDPRLCRLLPWWIDMLSREGIAPRFLFVVRSPAAVCRSLAHRDGFSAGKGMTLWLLHYLEAVRDSSGHPRAFMAYDDFLDNPVRELARIEERLSIHFPIAVQSAAQCLKRFLSADLRHHSADTTVDGGRVAVLADELDRRMRRAAVDAATEDGAIDVADLLAELEAIQSGFDAVLVEHMRAAGQVRGRIELTMRRVMRSWSWSLGRPVRYLERIIGRDV